MKVKFARNIGRRLLEEIKQDGPFYEGDEADVPDETADFLIAKNLAELAASGKRLKAVPDEPKIGQAK